MLNAEPTRAHDATPLWHPMAHPAEMRASPPIVLTRAEGVMLEDSDGHGSLDAVGGLWCVNLGHSCQPIKDAIRQQLDVRCEPHAAHLAFVRELLRLRHAHVVPRLAGIGGHAGEYRMLADAAFLVRWTLGDGSVLTAVANLCGSTARIGKPCSSANSGSDGCRPGRWCGT